MKYRIEEQKERLDGKIYVRPFIGDWNVWSIPKKEYTPAVEEAIKHAYQLGLRFMEDEMREKASDARHALEFS